MFHNAVYLDALLALFHFLAIFAVVGTLSLELALCKGPLDQAAVRRLAGIDAAFGVAAVLAVVSGFLRAVYGIKGWSWYSENPFFWLKLSTFVILALISIVPTVAFMRWKKQNLSPSAAQTAWARKYIIWETILLPLLPLCAVLMSRAIGNGTIPTP